MPSPTTNPESVARSVLEKAPAAGAARTPAQERGDLIREKANKEGARSALEALREKPKIDKGATDRLLDENIGIKRKPNGEKNRSGAEKARFDEAKLWKGFNEELLEKGYDGMSATNQGVARTQVEQALRVWPQADNLLSSMPAAEKDAVIVELLKDPKFSMKFREVYDKTFSADKAIKDAVSEAQGRVLEVQARKTTIDGEVNLNTAKLNDINTRLDRYKIDPTTGNPVGADIVRIKDIETRLPSLNADLLTKNGELESLKDERKIMENSARVPGSGITPADIITKGAEIREKQKEIKDIEDQFAEKQSLEQNKIALDSQKLEVQQKLAELKVSREEVNRELSQARADASRADIGRTGGEEGFVDEIKGMVSETTMRAMEEKVSEAETAERELIENEIKASGDPAEKAILQALLERWEKDKTVGVWSKSQIKVYNKEQINEDFSKLMTSGDPKEIMRNMMSSSGLSAAEIDAKLSDPAFIDKLQPKVVERLLTYKMQTGKLNEDEVRRVFNSEWGVGMIQKAIARKGELQSALNDLEAKGILQGGMKEWLRKASGGSRATFLLLLLAALAGSAVAIKALPFAISGGAAAANYMT